MRRARRVWAAVAPEALPEALAWLKEQGFAYLSTVTGFDEGENLGAYYHATDTHIICTVKALTPRANPHLPSILSVYPVAVSYEKELEDVLGIKVDGLPPGRRYPLAEDFPVGQYPLRKDWNQDAYVAAEAAKMAQEAK